MKQSRPTRRKMLLAALGGLAPLGIPPALAQDPARTMPGAYRVAFENDRIRVLDFVGRPGMGICGEGMHSHPAHLTVVLSDWDGMTSTPDTGAKPLQRRLGDVFWSEAEMHKVENTGRANSRVLIIELKERRKA
jgi:beta-alanine degradation protein BauB